MRKLTPKQILKLTVKGVGVNVGGKRYVRPPKEKPVKKVVEGKAIPVAAPVPQDTEITEAMISNHNLLIQNCTALANCLNEISKPRPARKMICTVGRDTMGNIKTVNITEK